MADAQSTTTPVEYREIPRLPGYRLGADGSFWSCIKPLPGGGVITDRWKRVRMTLEHTGYLVACVTKDKKSSRVYLHALMLEAFVGPRPPGMVCCHWDGNTLNNRIENLRWDTRVGNKSDERRHGTNNIGSRNGISKLTEQDIPRIREMRINGYVYRVIANRFNVSEAAIRRVITGECWAHV